MAVILQMTYSKKLGLPNFSSHQCSVSLQAEITDVQQLSKESGRLYRLMQDAVDREMQEVGFLPDSMTYGMEPEGSTENRHASPKEWKCSDRQRQLIESIVSEHALDKREIETLAQKRFGVGVTDLNRLQASGLIDELLESYGKAKRNGSSSSGKRNGRTPKAGRYQ